MAGAIGEEGCPWQESGWVVMRLEGRRLDGRPCKADNRGVEPMERVLPDVELQRLVEVQFPLHVFRTAPCSFTLYRFITWWIDIHTRGATGLHECVSIKITFVKNMYHA